METMAFDIKDHLDRRKSQIDEALEHYLPKPAGLERNLLEATRYSLFAGGKRLRPILCLEAAAVVGGAAEEILPVACALEFIHTYSLIHDDLPAMDNDDFRRGKPTSHKVFGEAVAILAGDALLTEAFGLIHKAGEKGRLPPDKLLEVVGILVKAAGYRGMIGGQVIDLESEARQVDLATVEYMHAHKTGALLSASLEIGALLGGGTRDQVSRLTRYGHHFGMAFQITDDVLDIEGEAAVMGKQPGSDVARNKKTYPALAGLVRSREAARENVEVALAVLASFDDKAEPLRALARYLLVRRA
jgi:geranylgeranyl diphosphate synthase type II